jgi:hypothetical protein
MSKMLLAFVAAAILAALGPLSAEAQDLKTRLLKPPNGWVFEWSNPDTGNHGITEAVFEDRGGKVVAKLNMVDEGAVAAALRSCEREVTLSSDTISLDGCRDSGLVLIVDRSDAIYVLKSTKRTNNGYSWKGKVK